MPLLVHGRVVDRAVERVNGWYDWVAGGGGGALVLLLGVLAIRFFARQGGMPGDQTIDTSEPASNVAVRTDVDGHLARGGVSDADKKDMASYLLEQIRSEGLLPALPAARSPHATRRNSRACLRVALGPFPTSSGDDIDGDGREQHERRNDVLGVQELGSASWLGRHCLICHRTGEPHNTSAAKSRFP